ncbi:MAG: DNA alkylation repair protein [Muribaculaceae bacterium]|nr:DNA alkylation repair protein [Muribaculaceae bacterium]
MMELREAKQQFFALRNGLLADTIRQQTADPHRLIFGLNLPQLTEIAAQTDKDETLADTLWADADCRESRLLAPMVCPHEAPRTQWLEQVKSVEEADILCHRLLRHQPEAETTALRLTASSDPLMRYAALRLLLNLMPASADTASSVIGTIPEHHLTSGIVRQINEELQWLK